MERQSPCKTARGLSYERTMGVFWQIVNASVSRFKYNPRGFALSGFEELSLLEPGFMNGEENLARFCR